MGSCSGAAGEMAASTPLLALLLLAADNSERRDLLKEANNEIEHGPAYPSHHKQRKWEKLSHKAASYHAWANKLKGVQARKTRYGHPGEHQVQVANTAFDQDNIHLQRLDTDAPARRKAVPKSLSQMKKKAVQKPSKKMDKMYKKLLEKRLHLKREKHEQMKRKKQQTP